MSLHAAASLTLQCVHRYVLSLVLLLGRLF